MVYRAAHTRLGQAPEPPAQIETVTASIGGVNALDALMRMPPQDCIYAYNLMPSERGMQLRKGYREWANGAGTEDVRTILNYESQKQDSAQDRLWAVTKEGIYNVTTFGDTSPTKDVTFSSSADPAGYGVKCEFTNDASDHYMFYADAVNGLHQYKEGTGWSIPTGGTGAGEWYYTNSAGVDTAFPIADIAFVTVFKQRIWVVLEDSDDAWYLPVASVAGKLTKFTFGAKLDHGGDLMGLWTWSVDGGAGMDDLLVGVSRGGDLVVYQGNDPALNDFGMIGSWFIGAVPNSRRITASYGAEMYILSSFGITSVRDLLQGAAANELRSSPSAKINKYLRVAIEQNITASEWSLNIHPGDGFLQVVTPDPGSNAYVQYNQNLNTKAWGMWEAVPMVSADTWNGEYYMGGENGKVYEYAGVLDGTLLDGTIGEPIEYRMLTAFQTQLNHATFKQIGFVRTLTIATSFESYNARAVYDYKENEAIPQSSDALGSAGAQWDSDLWDSTDWDYVTDGESTLEGALGIGRTFAIGMRGQANARIEVLGWDVTFVNGGFL